MAQIADLIGQRFDKLIVESAFERTPSGTKWLCRCTCGATALKMTSQLRRLGVSGKTGCRGCEKLSRSDASARATHGGCKLGRSPVYGLWKRIRSRCSNPKTNVWKYYGGKGIVVCAEWQVFETFRDWAISAGYQPGLSIDRLDSDGNYEPGNCEIVTRSENSRRCVAAQREKRNGTGH